MHLPTYLISSLAILAQAVALPATSQAQLKSAVNAVPGESSLFRNYQGKKTPLASNYTKFIPATGSGPKSPDDLLFQNLLSAEWVIYSLYQEAVELFSPSNFTKLGLPNNTYERIAEIRDNEAGHIRIFQDQISNNSAKPGPCKYGFGFENTKSAQEFLAIQVFIEVASMAFLTGLSNQADLNVSKSALMAIGQIESRHNTWALIDVWNTDPFSGPVDTVYPYANQILELTNQFILPGSCPSQNPVYPSPRQHLPTLSFNTTTTKATPGSTLEFVFSDQDNQPKFDDGKDYYVVFYHGLNIVSVPYDPKKNTAVIPKEFDTNAGIIMASIADEVDAPTESSVVSGPLIILAQPGRLTLVNA